MYLQRSLASLIVLGIGLVNCSDDGGGGTQSDLAKRDLAKPPDLACNCPSTGNECIASTCTTGVCGTRKRDQTHALTTGQTDGNCQKIACDGNGGTTSADDPTDTPAEKPCLIMPVCTGTPLAPSFTRAPAGTRCGVGATCTADGVCKVGCNSTNCPPPKACFGSVCAFVDG